MTEPLGRVVSLHVYPMKSAGGIEVEAAAVDVAGLRDDRRWMIVDPQGSFVSQRSHPRLALVRTRWTQDTVEADAPGVGSLRLPRAPREVTEYVEIPVWGTERYALDCGDEAARWASEYLGMPCRVVEAVAPPGLPVLDDDGEVKASFADGSPALVISEASLADLNARLPTPLPMDRFRPNIVVDGMGPFEEDVWGRRQVGEVPTRGGRPCPRCATTLVDQETGEKGLEPLRTLATYRRNARGEVDFGVNIFFEGRGVLRRGDPVLGETA